MNGSSNRWSVTRVNTLEIGSETIHVADECELADGAAQTRITRPDRKSIERVTRTELLDLVEELEHDAGRHRRVQAAL